MKILVNVIFNINQSKGDYERTIRPKEYIFAAYEEMTAGDVVVVETANGFQLVTVTGIAERLPRSVPLGDLKEVVCKVDFSEFEARKQKMAKMKELKAEMDKKVKVLQNNAIYEMLAEKDPSLKAMFEEYKALLDD